MILSILDFSADSYAWYIEMYIGLFLIIPFLNILWNNLNDVGRKWLIITLLGLTALPSLLNCWDFLSLGDQSAAYCTGLLGNFISHYMLFFRSISERGNEKNFSFKRKHYSSWSDDCIWDCLIITEVMMGRMSG